MKARRNRRKPKAGLTGYSVSNLQIPGMRRPGRAHRQRTGLRPALDIMIACAARRRRVNNEFGRPNTCGYFRTSNKPAWNQAAR